MLRTAGASRGWCAVSTLVSVLDFPLSPFLKRIWSMTIEVANALVLAREYEPNRNVNCSRYALRTLQKGNRPGKQQP